MGGWRSADLLIPRYRISRGGENAMKWKLRNEKGQNLVEMALVMMLLLLLLAGAVDIGRAFHDYIIITNAAREGARRGARLPCTPTVYTAYKGQITNAAIAEAANSGVTLSSGNVLVYIGNTPMAGCPSANAEIKVTVNYTFSTILGSIIGQNSFPLGNSASMLWFGNDQ